jgi:putative transposase
LIEVIDYFFRNLKHGIKTAPPGFKKVRRYKSFTLKQAGYKLINSNRIKIMGQEYKYHKSREIEGTIKTLTIKRDALGDIYLYFVCNQEETEIKSRSGKSVGLDFGLATFLTSSDGNNVEAPLFFKRTVQQSKNKTANYQRRKKAPTIENVPGWN